MKNSYLYSALVAAVSISIAKADSDLPQNNRERCYGVAKAGENDCQGTDKNGEKHECFGWAEADNDPRAWVYVPKGECQKRGGSFNPPPAPSKKPE